MIDLEEIKSLDDKTLITLYQLVSEHIKFLDNSVLELSVDEESDEEDEEEEKSESDAEETEDTEDNEEAEESSDDEEDGEEDE